MFSVNLNGREYNYVIASKGNVISDYTIDIFDDVDRVITKNVKLCTSNTKVYYIRDEFSNKEVCEIGGRHIVDIDDTLISCLIKFYYTIGKDGLYELHSIDGKKITEGIEDYILDLTNKTTDYATYMKNKEWYMCDIKGNIIAKSFDINKSFSFITVKNKKYLFVNNVIYDEQGVVLNLLNKKMRGVVGDYLVVSNAIVDGLVDLQGNWFYKKSKFDDVYSD